MRRLPLGDPIVLSYIAAVLLFAVVSLYSPGFASPAHIATLVTVASFIGIVAIGQTIVIIGGGIDLSVPWFMTTAAMLVTGLSRGQSQPLIWIVPLTLLAGLAAGAVNGVGIAFLRVPPIVMTMSVNVIIQGVLLLVTRGFPPPPAPAALQFVAAGKLGPVPVMAIFWFVLTVIVVFVERRTSFGRSIYAIGSSRAVASLSGIPVARTVVISYALCGMTAALGGVLVAGYSRQAYLGMGDPYLFTSIAAVAIGGASILGGTGSYLGTVAGAMVLTILTGLLPIFRLDAGALRIIYGAVILVTVAIAAPWLRGLLRRQPS